MIHPEHAPAPVHLDRHDVDAPVTGPVALLDIGLAQGDEACLLGCRDRLFRRAHRPAPPRAHLDQNQAFAISGHQVQLARLAAPVLRYNLVSLGRELLGSQLLTPPAQALAVVLRDHVFLSPVPCFRRVFSYPVRV